MANAIETKSFANTYLYNKGNYEALLYNFIMKSEEIDTNDESFEEIRYEVKRRQVSNALVKVMDSKNIILKESLTPLPKAFKVFSAKDLKGDKTKTKVYIDCDVIRKVDGIYKCSNVDILIAYLVSAGQNMIYYIDPKRLVMRTEIIKSGAKCFSALFTHVVDYLYKISNMGNIKYKCLYLSAMYYLLNILGKSINDSTKGICRQISGLSEREEEILLAYMEEGNFDNIKIFIDALGETLKLRKLTLDVFLEKWLFLYGSGTQYALELFPSFTTMLTDVYVGCYLNHQKTIEKVTGKNMVDFSLAIIQCIQGAV